ncbi:ATP-binding cassette sub-family A member 7 [Pseudovirgaria hyperparasitica]|uniref:ATP-binding cassette sub-family A member 7 n=1 Tax=Pseudovirgaria hyperparasitica TaxID=470096 RepID=A0A6A6WLN3_9PEZI|nr:ATP-binding cassette sub-family A member 7 [Pseudovirgaria hyperparasitica]KAF2763115.1 ATP-binding cassette sub-family A member 7 [Pseudovirgaria hyperparasitica]
MAGFFSQVWTLTVKNLLIVLVRAWLTTPIRAFIAPIIFMFFVSYSKNFFIPPAEFGVGSPSPLRSLPDAFAAAGDSRTTVAFVNNGFTGGQIEGVINDVANQVRMNGKEATVVGANSDLLEVCRSSLRGASICYGAVVFHGSPSEGTGFWNYTVRADGAFGASIFVDQSDNEAQLYLLPLQHAIDSSIIGTNGTTFPANIDQYVFTSRTDEQRARSIQNLFMNSLITIFGLAFYVGVCGVTYQLTGHMASERELGISQLIEAMVPNTKTWHTQWARLLSLHLAFDIIYLPGWIIMGIILAVLVFPESSVAISLLFHILTGLALTSFSIFGGSLFRKAQLSGITVTLFTVVLAIVAQVARIESYGAVLVLSLIFPPMNYVFFIIYQARFEGDARPTKLDEFAPAHGRSTFEVHGYTFFIFMGAQFVIYPVLAAFTERWLYGTADKRRSLHMDEDSPHAVELSNFSKHYVPSNWRQWTANIFRTQPPETVIAVNNLTISARTGNILALLGANGSGKSTTLNAVTGLSNFNGGSIKVDGTGGLGYCPQKNVMWDDLTVEEHIRIFNRLKSSTGFDTKQQNNDLASSVDLGHKFKARSKTLSGGQKRKLQLAMMFTGGSKVCAIDEISSGLDPVSRRKIWDILMAERGIRTMILTTHFLDEADVLADRIAILSKGNLKAEGSAAELKHHLGGGYRIYLDHSFNVSTGDMAISGLRSRVLGEKTVYQMPTSADAAAFVAHIETQGFTDYQVTGPSIEDVFLKLAEEVKESFGDQNATQVNEDAGDLDMPKSADDPTLSSSEASTKHEEHNALDITSGSGLSMFAQGKVLFRKRFIILQRNFFPYVVVLLLPIIAAGLVTLFLQGFNGLSCDPGAASSNPPVTGFPFAVLTGRLNETTVMPIGPPDRVTSLLSNLTAITGLNESNFAIVNTLQEFQDYIATNFSHVKPGGFFLGDTPTFAFEGDEEIYFTTITLNVLDNVLAGSQIWTDYQTLAVPFAPTAGDTLQLILYFGLAMCAFPGFLALYPAAERIRKVRALHYSNGIRAAPLWLAYLLFDTLFVTVVAAITVGIFVGASSVWYGPGYMFVGFWLYGIASALIAYIVSLFATSQLAAFAVTVGLQCSMFLLYFVIVLCITVFTDAIDIPTNLTIGNFAWNIITPAGTLLQILLLSLNQFQLLCTSDNTTESYPGTITIYGGPILYLIIQIAVLLGFLIWWDSGSSFGLNWLKKKAPATADSESDSALDTKDPSVATEASRLETIDLPLKVNHVSKHFGRNLLAVDDVTFGIAHSEVFALLGPNGAGKSTTISLIRGDITPSYRNGDILVENTSISKHRAKARLHLGVCPQFDAMDTMTVTEHLAFYARVRGVPKADVQRNVDTIVRAVGLMPYTQRMAAKLSGGNQRKLSLAIAMMGNPSVLLLDEPSSGMDAAAKRVMWRTLSAVSKGRALLITTHSMEEADALATRAGIMAGRMLAVGTTDELRHRYGGGWYVHLVLYNASTVSKKEMENVARWVAAKIPGARVQGQMMHGQIRLRVENEKAGAGSLFEVLEREGRDVGIEYYSVGRATLDQVFLEIIGPREDE